MARRFAAAPLLAAASLTFTSCATPTDSVNDSGPAISLSIVSGDAQSSLEFTQLPEPIVAQLLNSRGRPVKGQIVNFRAMIESGSVWAGSAITDANGIAKEWWTLGPHNSLEKILEARTIDPVTGERIVLATARATTRAWQGEPLILCAFPGQTSFVPTSDTDCPANFLGHSVPNGSSIQIRFQVLDNGTPAAGVPLDVIVGGGGKVSPAQVYTGADGIAAITFTAGPTHILNSIQANFLAMGVSRNVDIKAGY